MSTFTVKSQHKTKAANQTETTLTLEGTLDNSTVANLETSLKSALQAKPTQLIFDLAGLKFITSSGIRLFFMAMKTQKANGGQTSFVHLQPQIKEVFAIMGSMPDLKIFSSQAELDSYLLSRQQTHMQ